MPSGAIDANGVYIFGTTDNEATHADLLNLGQNATSIAIGALRTRATSLETSRDNPTVFVANSDTSRNSHWGSPANATQRLALQNAGATTVRTDKGYSERYFAGLTDGGSNPGGAAVAGWYPVTFEGLYVKRRRITSTQTPISSATTVDFNGSVVANTDLLTYSAGVFTVAKAGRIAFDGQVSVTATGAGYINVAWRKGGTIQEQFSDSVVSGALNAVPIHIEELFVVGDTIDFRITSNATTAAVAYTDSSAFVTIMSATYKGVR